MRLNLFGRVFSALLAGLFGGHSWAAPFAVAGTWNGPQVVRFCRQGKTGIAAAKRLARKSRNRQRQRHGRA
ncbi:hypothetical protein [Pseudomonas sp. BGI-2]|uniref:hypothetical protein n=1 Tax=Pseudomonas sp. BGI-2 TaxID=2528211 RepID=UPI00103496A0|nr:hypothetical protein [Pseudomonas sp. BGI-2]TBN39177.1 hypothetical protein EYC95_21355 [Pseudomonas sp. BGI-2]